MSNNNKPEKQTTKTIEEDFVFRKGKHFSPSEIETILEVEAKTSG